MDEEKKPEGLRDDKGRFVKGVCPNRGGGRRKGTVSLANELTRQLEQGQTAETVVRSLIQQACEGNAQAMKILWDRFEGPVKQEMDVTSGGQPLSPPHDLSRLTREELDELERLTVKAVAARDQG